MAASDQPAAARGKKRVGAVAVIGAGIGGMQTALSLAESGFKVYLVEKNPAIGGTMAQLDKTFPTNDCAMCTLAPRLVDTGRHRNIEILTNSQVEKIEGEAGDFTVTVRKAPRFVDEAKCTSCGDCARACPVTRPSRFDVELGQRRAIYKLYAQAIPGAYSITKNERPPCVAACPANCNAQGYTALVRQKKYKEALDVVRDRVPLAAICGRVCPAFCEKQCNMKDVNGAVGIRALKRFLADWEMEHGMEAPKPLPITRKEKVAVIGSGPAGLTCAHDLLKLGYAVTVFEALPVPGGWLAVGIPDYRLPREIIRREIEWLVGQGIELRLNTPIGKALTIDDLGKQGFAAVFVATGAPLSRKLGIPGEDARGVLHGTDFLKDVNLGKKVPVPEKVAVIGGGDVAIDAVRTSLRLGAREASIIYRRSRDEMPANPEEIEAALEEGVKIHFLTAPVEVVSEDGRVIGIRCVRMELGEPDASGRRRPVPVKGSEFVIESQMVIPAIGQVLDGAFVESSGLPVARDVLTADPVSLETPRKGVFAGGDAVSGPATAVQAIAHGHRAAVSIDRFLRGEDLKAGREHEVLGLPTAPLDFDIGKVKRKPRNRIPVLPAGGRTASFKEVETGYTEELALAEAERCLDCGICCECMECVRACKPNAVDHKQKEQVLRLNVGSVILSPGFETFEPELREEFGFGLYPNVVSSLQYERMLSSSGPFGGTVQRPSDGKHPKKIAWLQCIGSRDEPMGKGYCSAVCCTYATKEAVITKEHAPGTETHIFFMDMRTFGKGFEEYFKRAQNDQGVIYHRCRVPQIEERPDTGDLVISWRDENDRSHRDTFDLVVLSVGVKPPAEVRGFLKRIGVTENEYGFAQTETLRPVETSRDGVYVAGVLQGPKDIPDTVAQGLGAAAKASGLLAEGRGTLVKNEVFPEEKDFSQEEPRVGVFICHCGANIAGIIDVKAVAASIMKRRDLGVVYADTNLYACSTDAQEFMKEKIREHRINRVVVSSCTPRTHEVLFQKMIREAGINPYLFELASIREHSSWVHRGDPKRATEKAKQLTAMAVEKVFRAEAVRKEPAKVTHKALIIGGGVAGMTAALELSSQGFESHLVEKDAELGGNARNIFHLLSGDDPQVFLEKLIARVKAEPRIVLHLGSRLADVAGFIGNFRATIKGKGKPEEVDVGAVIVATGARELVPEGLYEFGKHPGIITQLELDRRLHAGGFDARTVVMIQCVGSREDAGRTYCSRVCCSEATKNAIEIKKKHPGTKVYILYRDIRTYGFNEKHYQKARELGVIFLRYENEDRPAVRFEDGKIRLEVNEHTLKMRFRLKPDLLVLSAATVPADGNAELGQILKVPLTEHGFFMEAHAKIAPLSFTADGIYLCGTAHSPRFLDETISQALGAAQKAIEVLSQETVAVEGIPVVIDATRCTGCGLCEAACPTKAVKVNPRTGVAEVTEVLCKGCGACSAACPSGCPSSRGFSKDQINAMVDSALEEL